MPRKPAQGHIVHTACTRFGLERAHGAPDSGAHGVSGYGAIVVDPPWEYAEGFPRCGIYTRREDGTERAGQVARAWGVVYRASGLVARTIAAAACS
jgi:hypothetical protein